MAPLSPLFHGLFKHQYIHNICFHTSLSFFGWMLFCQYLPSLWPYHTSGIMISTNINSNWSRLFTRLSFSDQIFFFKKIVKMFLYIFHGKIYPKNVSRPYLQSSWFYQNRVYLRRYTSTQVPEFLAKWFWRKRLLKNTKKISMILKYL